MSGWLLVWIRGDTEAWGGVGTMWKGTAELLPLPCPGLAQVLLAVPHPASNSSWAQPGLTSWSYGEKKTRILL